MGTEEKEIEEIFKEELAKGLDVINIAEYPVTLSVNQDALPDLERWRSE